MIRRSPCELYIKYLLSHPSDKSIERIREIVRGQQLDYPSDVYVERLQAKMVRPEVYAPYDTTHNPSAHYLSRHQLMGFYHPDRASTEAQRLVAVPRAKELIETMAISGDAPAAISFRLREAGVHTFVEGVERYLAYYWNLDLVDSTELRGLLALRYESVADASSGSDARLQKLALSKAQRKDPRRVAADMPATPMASIINQMRLGYMPSKFELSKVAASARAVAVLRAFEAGLDGGGTYAAATTRDFVTAAKDLTTLIKEIGDPDATLQKQLQTLAIETETAELPHIKHLSGGNHTTEFGPKVREGARNEPQES